MQKQFDSIDRFIARKMEKQEEKRLEIQTLGIHPKTMNKKDMLEGISKFIFELNK